MYLFIYLLVFDYIITFKDFELFWNIYMYIYGWKKVSN